MEKLDVRGLSCPIPVIRAKKLIDQGCTEILIVGDSAPARENVSRLAKSSGYQTLFITDEKDNWELEIKK
ncbi:MAG: sulfurtransferase TusA family protein [Syntrophomonas sp.]